MLAATATLLHLGLHAWVWGAARVEAQQSARYALERMASELREAGYDPTAAGHRPRRGGRARPRRRSSGT